MTSLRPFHALDVFKFNPTNLDPLTETYDLNFYFSYLARWPHLFNVALSPTGSIDAYRTSPSLTLKPKLTPQSNGQTRILTPHNGPHQIPPLPPPPRPHNSSNSLALLPTSRFGAHSL